MRVVARVPGGEIVEMSVTLSEREERLLLLAAALTQSNMHFPHERAEKAHASLPPEPAA